MDNHSRLEEIAARLGTLITKVSREVAYEFAAEYGANAHGYEVASPEDIEQRVYLKLAETDVTADELLAKDAPQSVMRLYARNAAKREVEQRHRKHAGDGLGFRERPADFNAILDSEDPVDALSATVSKLASPMGNPLGFVLSSEFETRLTDLAEDLISKVSGRAAEVLALWVHGEDAKAISAALGTSYGQARNYLTDAKRALDDEEWEALAGVRAYLHPEAKRPKPTGATPTALIDLVRS